MKKIVVGLLLGAVAGEVSYVGAAQTLTTAGIARSSADGAIAGHVTDARSKPIDAYSVVVFPTDRKTWAPTSPLVKFARPAQDGGFEVAGLPPGEYWVAAVDAIQGNQATRDFTKPEVLEVLATRATRVMLGDHERYMTVLRLIRR